VPLLGEFNETGTHGISLNVAQHREEVVVLLDGESFEASHNVTKLPTIVYESVISRSGLRP
jgi:hypothetical protein